MRPAASTERALSWAFALGVLCNGCATKEEPKAPSAASSSSTSSPPEEQRPAGAVRVVATPSAGNLEVSLAQPIECRRAGTWTPCNALPLASWPIVLRFADGQELSRTTDTSGRTTFDLSGVKATDKAMSGGHVNLRLSTGETVATIDLAPFPFYAEWQQRQGSRGVAARQQASDRLDQSMAEDCFTKIDAALTKFERMTSPTETEASKAGNEVSDAFERCKPTMRFMAPDQRFQPMMARADKVSEKMHAISVRQCKARWDALQPELRKQGQLQASILQSSCYSTCTANGWEMMTCMSRCDSVGWKYRAELVQNEQSWLSANCKCANGVCK